MAGSDQPATENKQQQSITQPWAPSQPLLTNILSQLGSVGTAPTQSQLQAIQRLQGSASEVPNFGGAAAGAVGNAFGTNTAPQQGMLSGALGSLQGNLGGYASGKYLDPWSTPGFGDAMKTMNSDITNQINGQFAAAGRDLSPANSTALARGLSQGQGGLLQSQYNTNLGMMNNANNALFSGAGQTAGGLTNQQLAQLQAQQSGITAAGSLPGLYTSPAQTQLGAANAGFSLPYSNIGMLEGLVNPIAGLGGQTNASGTGTSTPANSPNSNLVGGILGGAGTAMQFLPWMLSDARTKEDIEPVGHLHDGSNVYSFKYKHDPSGRVHIGLLAQEVETMRPDAVVELGPDKIKAVDYGRATERARAIGGLLSNHLPMAA